MPWLSLGLGVVFFYIAASAALESYPLARAWLSALVQVGAGGSVLWVVAVRRRQWHGCERLFWLTIAYGAAAWLVGHAGWTWGTLVEGHARWVGWHTVFSFCGAAAPLIALLARPHLGPRHNAYAVAAIDIGAVTVVTGFVATYFILIPHIAPQSASTGWVGLMRLAEIQRTLMLAGMIAAAIAARHLPWAATYWRLAAVLAVSAALRTALNVALASGRHTDGSLYDLAWIVPYLGYAWAAAESPASKAVDPRAVEGPAGSPWITSAAVAAVPVLGYGVHFAWPLGEPADAARILLTTSTVIVGLALVTIRMIVQRTELRRVDQRLRLLAAVTEHTQELVLIVRADGRFEEGNDAFLLATGYTREELSRASVTQLIVPAQSRVRSEIHQAVRSAGVWRGTLVRQRKDGSTFPASCTVTCLRDEAGRITHYIGIERDVSDEVALREQLIHSERMSAMSEVVAGVAHEINNPLQAILGSTELLLDGSSGQARTDLEIVRGEAIRAGQIVRNLLSFVHRGTGQRQPVDLNDIVRTTVALRSYHLEQNGIVVDLVCHPSPLPVNANPDEIRQVLLNVLLNAEHAIRRSGKGGRIAVSTWADDRHACAEISDDGPGIPAQHRGRIFEPFFTTKEVGEGTGLGLSISLGIALAHGGGLEFRPSAAGGATFRLTVPTLVAAPARYSVEIPGTRSALIIEDDDAIGSLLTRLLERRGFAVAHVLSGTDALEHLRAGLPDLVISDARMPRMNGQEFFGRGRDIQPGLPRRFVLMTGDSASGDVSEFAEQQGVPLLRKPFTAVELDTVLARVAVADDRAVT